jgi:hypothetical protein
MPLYVLVDRPEQPNPCHETLGRESEYGGSGGRTGGAELYVQPIRTSRDIDNVISWQAETFNMSPSCSPNHRTLPDPKICRANQIDTNLWECLVSFPIECPFKASCGIMFFCMHADLEISKQSSCR